MRKFLRSANNAQAISIGYYAIGNLFGSFFATLSLWLVLDDFPYYISPLVFLICAILTGYFISAFLLIIHLIIMSGIAQTALSFKWQVFIGGVLALLFELFAFLLLFSDFNFSTLTNSKFFPFIQISYFLGICVAAWSILDAGKSNPKRLQISENEVDHDLHEFSLNELTAFNLLISAGIVTLVIGLYGIYSLDLATIALSIAVGAMTIAFLLPALFIQFILNAVIRRITKNIRAQWIAVCLTFSGLIFISLSFISMFSPFEELRATGFALKFYFFSSSGVCIISGIIVYRLLLFKHSNRTASNSISSTSNEPENTAS